MKPKIERWIYTNFGNIPVFPPDDPEPAAPDRATPAQITAIADLHRQWEEKQQNNVFDKLIEEPVFEVLSPDGNFVRVRRINERTARTLYQIQAGYRVIWEPEGREVLTMRGWVPVQSLHEGDQIVVRTGGDASQANEVELLEGGTVRLTRSLNPRLYEPGGCRVIDSPPEGDGFTVHDFVLAKNSGYECNGVVLRGQTE